MTRIAVFCDGTWNSPSIPEPTSVHKLADALVNDATQGQVVAYFPGIGVDTRFDGPVRRTLTKYGGGVFGWGLDAKVKQAYQFISQAYASGDEIYLFGFSRGAYTARSVAGMIRKCGIIRDTSPEGVNAAFTLYRRRGRANAPDQPHIREARRAMSPAFATSDEDLAWRNDSSELVKLAYMGVWDTVGARGIPVSLFGPVATLWNRQYTFHDMQLSRLVRSARHALAIDERRVLYKPAKWNNLDGPKGLNSGDEGALRPYQQVWFAGNHSVVGGSGTAPGLSSYPLDWVIQGAGRLTLKPDAAMPPVPADAIGGDFEVKSGFLARWRDGPHHERELHPSVGERTRGRSDYRPVCVWRVLKNLGQ